VAILAVILIKCARKLYGSTNDRVKSFLQPFKAVWYDSSEVPESAAPGISIIGDFKSQLGAFCVEYPATMFLRWLCTALESLKEHTYLPPLPDVNLGVDNMVFRFSDGAKLVLDYAQKIMSAIRSEELEIPITVGGVQTLVTVCLPEYTDETFAQWNTLPGLDDDARTLIERWRRVGLCLMITDTNLDNNTTPRGTPPALDLTTVLRTIGLELAPAAWTPAAIRDAYSLYQAYHSREVAPHLHGLMKMVPSPSGDTGASAQLIEHVDESELSATSTLPQSDADWSVGYLYHPLLQLEWCPKVQVYSRTTRTTALAQVTATGLKPIGY
jgi:hypothetical protein